VAAAYVSGVAALIRGEWPTSSVAWVTARLQGSAVDLGAVGTDIYYGHGRVDAEAALGPWPAITAGEWAVQPNQTCQWSGAAGASHGSPVFRWFKNTTHLGYGPNILVNVGSTDFTLNLNVWDGQGIMKSTHRWITVSSEYGAYCPE
jgi:hypothetical protein